MKRKRVIGTTDAAIRRTEAELGRFLPPSYREWLLSNNGRGVEDVSVFPVRDERDLPSTWDSIVRQFDGGNWPGEQFEDLNLSHLLPFSAEGDGDLYCFDYRRLAADGEAPVVIFSHETGETDDFAETFAEFVDAVVDGELDWTEDAN